MTTTELKAELTSLLDVLPETKLALIYDLAQFLAEREFQAGWMNAQSQSVAYREWVSSANDIYDELFDGAVSTR